MFLHRRQTFRGGTVPRKNYPAKLMPKTYYYMLLMLKYMRYYTQ